MHFAAFSIWDAIGVPSTKAPIANGATFALYILPPLLLYFVMAVLAITPQTRLLRMACWPVVALLALRASVSVDLAPSSFERKFHNDLASPMLMLVTRSLYWAFAKEPLVRQLRPVNSTPSTLMDALDLVLTFRGYGWNWSRGLYVPRETRPSNRTAFVSYVTLSAAVHAFICGTFHRAVRSFSPAGLGAISGISIFDETLPFHLRYFRSCIISIISCIAIRSFLQTCYDSCTVVGILIFRQDPAQWPPCFDSPWCATSLAEFWGRRWHQFFRHTFLVQGGYPLSFIFGRAGFVFGAFISSAIYHYIGLYSFDDTTEFWRMLVGFGMMAPGVFAERAFTQITGRKVCGLAGWVWTLTWILLWGSVIIDGFVRVGSFVTSSFIDFLPSWRALVECLVIDFDTWLHAV